MWIFLRPRSEVVCTGLLSVSVLAYWPWILTSGAHEHHRKLIGVIVGLLLFRNPWGAIIGLILGHFYDQSVSGLRRSGGGAGVLEIGERFFTATFEVMGRRQSRGRVSEEEIAAARKVMAELRLNGAQIHAAITISARKSSEFDLESTMQQFVDTCAHRPDLMRVFLEVQVRACLEGVDMQGPGGIAVQKVADLLDVSRIELAHIWSRCFACAASSSSRAPAPVRQWRRQWGAAAQCCAVECRLPDSRSDPKAANEEVAKAYRRQLSRHHPDKLKSTACQSPCSNMPTTYAADHRGVRQSSQRGASKLMAMAMSSMNTPWIAPSILSADFARLGDEVNAVLAAGADVIHFDVMDNHYVPNLTIGPLVCEALRKHGITAPLDVHLMVKPVDRIVPDFAKAGATYISFHPEASDHVDRTIELIRENGCKPGLVFNPATPLYVPRSHAGRSWTSCC